VVGPCFQIVKPLDGGKINGAAKISTSAVLVADNSTNGTVDLSGATLNITVNGQAKTVQFPAVVAGAQFTRTQILNVINEQLAGLAVASYDSSNRLVIKTNAKGPVNASLSVTYVAAGTVEKLGFTSSKSVTGMEAYTGMTYSSFFADLPSTKTTTSELVFDVNNLDAYRDFNNVLYNVSKTSAVQWYSVVPENDAGSQDLSITSSHWRRHALFAKNKPGPKTNVVVHNGTQAEVKIPLTHTVGGSNIAKWPDVTGDNFIKVECVGPAGQGLYIGNDGNTVSVTFDNDQNAGANVDAVWDANAKNLKITYKDACTFTELKTELEGAFTGFVANAIKVTVSFNPALAATAGALKGITTAQVDKTFNLWGGQDPARFTHTAAQAGGERAVVRGSVTVGQNATADSLGVGGEKLYVSVDGDPYVELTLTGNSAVIATIDTHPKITASVQTLSLVDGSTTTVIELTTDPLTSSKTGADSTISIKADKPFVLEQLFGGFSGRLNETIAAQSLSDAAAWANAQNGVVSRKVKLAPGSSGNYNKTATSFGEKAVLPGSIKLSMTNLVSAGTFIFAAAASMTAQAGDAKRLTLLHSNGAEFTLDLNAPQQLTNPTRAQLVDRIVDRLVAANNTDVACALVGDHVVLSDATGSVAATLKIVDVDVNKTTQNVKDWLGSAATHWGVNSTTVATADVTVQDTGTSYAWQVTGFDAELTQNWKVASGIVLNNSYMTQLLLDPTTNPPTGFNYSSGKTELLATVEGALVFRGQGVGTANPAPAVATLAPLTVRLGAQTAGTISYSRLHDNAVRMLPTPYQGRVFQGRPNQIKVGDVLYNNGLVKGRVVGFESSTYAGTLYTDNALVLSDFSVDNDSSIQDWYVVAENLQTESPARLEPELTVSELNQKLTIKHTVNRTLAGIPVLDANAFIYIGYKALRKDVSADTANPELKEFSSLTEVENQIGPIDPDNPLAFAMYVAFLHLVDTKISALGVNAVSADSPEGTVQAYKEALDFLTLKEVYALTPLSQDPGVHDLFSLHCNVMSEPEGRKERIALVNRALPTEKVPTLVASGTAVIGPSFGNNNTLYNLTFTDPSVNLYAALNQKVTANGALIDLDASGGALTPTNGVFLDREGDPYNYLVVNVTPSTLTIQVGNVYGPGSGPGSGGNGDSYFRTSAPAGFEVDGEFCAVYVRQAALNLNTTAGKSSICEALAEIAGGPTGYQNRRLFIELPEKVGLPFNGTELLIPGYYLCVADVARIAQLSPAQPFTNLPYNGFTRVVGSSDKFSENQMATAAAGGIWWVIQDTPGGALACRHQLSTDASTLKTRELSITKSVDYVAKLVRNQVRSVIGRNNITPALLSQIGLSIGASLTSVSGTVVSSASIDGLQQDASNPDTVLVDISLTPFYPCNRIKITLKV